MQREERQKKKQSTACTGLMAQTLKRSGERPPAAAAAAGLSEEVTSHAPLPQSDCYTGSCPIRGVQGP